MDIQFWVAFGIIILLGFALTVGNRKKKWYKITRATNGLNRILCVYRKQGDYFFGENIKEFVTAHYADGKVVFIPKRWILLVERVSDKDVEYVLREVNDFNVTQEQLERESVEAS